MWSFRFTLLAALLACGCGEVIVPDGQAAGEDSNPGGVGGGGGGDLADAPAAVQQGARLFESNCQSCHGGNAAGGAVYPGSLQGRSGIAGQVRGGGGGMPAFTASQLSDGDIGAIEAWLAWLAEPGNGDGDGDGGDLHPFAAHCAGCHGPTGEGTELAPQIRSPHEGYATWVVRNGRATGGSLGFPQDMPSFGAGLSEADLGEIFTFLQSQPYPTDGAGLYARFCGNCHGPSGSGGVVGESARDKADDRDDFLETVRSGEEPGSYGDRTGFMPARGAGELSDAEVEKIRLFLLGRGA